MSRRARLDDPLGPAIRGRPRAKDPGWRVSTWLRASELDHVIKLAHDHEISVSAVLRSLVILKLR
jgi:hypothetical protein